MATSLVRMAAESRRWTVNGYAPEPADQPDPYAVQVSQDGPDRISVASYYTADEAREFGRALLAAADACDAARIAGDPATSPAGVA